MFGKFILVSVPFLFATFIFGQQPIVPPGSAGGSGPNNQQKCGGNETFTTCATRCEPKCNVTPGPCILMCDPPKCQCALGFVRDVENSRRCISAQDCPPPRGPRGQQGQQNDNNNNNVGPEE